MTRGPDHTTPVSVLELISKHGLDAIADLIRHLANDAMGLERQR